MGRSVVRIGWSNINGRGTCQKPKNTIRASQKGKVKRLPGDLGVIQGSRLGPYSFRVFANDLLSELAKFSDSIKSYCYADDLTLCGFSTTEKHRASLQKAIDAAATWSNTNSLAYNALKMIADY